MRIWHQSFTVPGDLPGYEDAMRAQPIIDGLASTMKMAELMVDLQNATGIKHSRQGWFNSVPGKARLDQVAAFYGVDKIKF